MYYVARKVTENYFKNKMHLFTLLFPVHVEVQVPDFKGILMFLLCILSLVKLYRKKVGGFTTL